MDDERRRTLALIEHAVRFSTPEERGRQLVLVVRDYVEDVDLPEALRVLRSIEQSYFEGPIYLQAAEERAFGEAVALLIETFGLGFAVLARPPASA